MTTKHTLAPWKFGDANNGKDWFVTSENGWDVAHLMHEMDTMRPVEEKEANARLIASAPCLLSALEECLKVLRHCDGPMPAILDAIDEAEHAIAKATGEPT